MTLSRFTWGTLLAAVCFGVTFSNRIATADESVCPYVADQEQVCPLSQDHCDEYLYDYELANVPEARTEETQEDEQDVVEQCPFRSIHDAIYDAEVYGLQATTETPDDTAEKCTETITVVHTMGRHSVEVEAVDSSTPESATGADEVAETDDFAYEDDTESPDYDNFDYESYEYEYYYEDELADLADEIDASETEEVEGAVDEGKTAESQQGQVAADDGQWDEYDAYDEYDYDEYYYENYESDFVEYPSPDAMEDCPAEAPAPEAPASEAPASEALTPEAPAPEVVASEEAVSEEVANEEVANEEVVSEEVASDEAANEQIASKEAANEEVAVPPSIDDESVEDLPVHYDEYGYDEYSVEESDQPESDDYVDYWKDVKVTGEESDGDLLAEDAEERAEQNVATDAEFEEYDDYWGEEMEATEPAAEDTADHESDLKAVADALTATGILPVAEILLGDISLDELAAKLPKRPEPKDVAESAPSIDGSDWENWDCYYDFEQEAEAQPGVETNAGDSLRFLQRQALKMLATSMDQAGRTLQNASKDLMRFSSDNVADAAKSTKQLK